MTYPKKLIEVALPLEAINKESAREKSIRHGHPSTLHLWWARRPLAAARAVLFSSLVDDPSEYIDDQEEQKKERERLFQLIEELVKWENINNDEVLDKAKLEIARSVARNLGEPMPVGKKAIEEFLATKAPPVLDPFAGGGTIPLEAQRLGLRAYASDLNPVAVLINKALIEIPPKFANMAPVHPAEKGKNQDELFKRDWKGAEGLAEDVRYYGQWIRDEAEKQIGYLYPKVKITQEMLEKREDLRQQGLKPGDKLTVIAWLWTRTITCENPLCGSEMPLIRSFQLSKKKGKQFFIDPITSKDSQKEEIHFAIKMCKSTINEGTINRSGAKCIFCGTPMSYEILRTKAKKNGMGTEMLAIVAQGANGKIYLSPTNDQINFASVSDPEWSPKAEISKNTRDFRTALYGFPTFGDLFTNRQLLVLNTFSELIREVFEKINKDIDSFKQSKFQNIGKSYDYYAAAISTYLAFALDKVVDYNSSICSWHSGKETIRNTFARQAIPMVWDFSESNPIGDATGNYMGAIDWITRVLNNLHQKVEGTAFQQDAKKINLQFECIMSTDPPYYDNIEYADLSDFFYVWLRKTLSHIYPDILATMLVPKSDELIASPFRFEGNNHNADKYFEDGLHLVFQKIALSTNPTFPTTIYYAFKQAETNQEGNIASTGWETMLQSLIDSKFRITGTWPIRTELSNRTIASGANALSSSIVLVCRPKNKSTQQTSRREFLSILRKELPVSLLKLQEGNVAPVDLAQAAIGPGMAIFTSFDNILEADGNSMSVRSALSMINQVLDEFLSEQEGNFDQDTRWSVTWFEQYGHEQAEYGIAETLSKAKNTNIQGLVEAGILESRSGHVRLLRRDELDENLSPEKDKQITTWKATQYLVRTLDIKGEQAAAELLKHLGSKAEPARDLAYRLYTICERKGWAQDALGYNMLVVAWPRLKELASKISSETQTSFL